MRITAVTLSDITNCKRCVKLQPIDNTYLRTPMYVGIKIFFQGRTQQYRGQGRS